MEIGLSEENLPLSMIRKFIRLADAYIIAYDKDMDIVQADAWIRKHRSHRSYSSKMDEDLEKLYYPLGREESLQHYECDNDDSIEEESEEDNSFNEDDYVNDFIEDVCREV